MVTRGPQHGEETRVPQGAERGNPHANKIGPSTPFDFSEKSSSDGVCYQGSVRFRQTGLFSSRLRPGSLNDSPVTRYRNMAPPDSTTAQAESLVSRKILSPNNLKHLR
jgi:hypothetical protein